MLVQDRVHPTAVLLTRVYLRGAFDPLGGEEYLQPRGRYAVYAQQFLAAANLFACKVAEDRFDGSP